MCIQVHTHKKNKYILIFGGFIAILSNWLKQCKSLQHKCTCVLYTSRWAQVFWDLQEKDKKTPKQQFKADAKKDKIGIKCSKLKQKQNYS